MKVICIMEAKVLCPNADKTPIVKVGHEYNVIGYDIAEDGTPCYELSEDVGYIYAQKLFAKTSSIDETEFERNYNKELI